MALDLDDVLPAVGEVVEIPQRLGTGVFKNIEQRRLTGWDVMRKQRWQGAIELGLVPASTKLTPVHADHRALDDLSSEEKALAARAMQVNAGMIEAADHHIGRLLDHLKSTGRLDNTIVVVTSDNGAESGVTSFDGFLPNLLLSGIHRLEGFDTSPKNMGLPGSLTAIGPEWASVEASPFSLYKFYFSEGGRRVPLPAVARLRGAGNTCAIAD